MNRSEPGETHRQAGLKEIASISGLSRRKFLIGGAVGIGLVVGYLAWPRNVPLTVGARPDETIINGWLKIGNDGRVIVLVPQAEMGQGVYTSLPMILAEELGANWQDVAVEPAPIHPIYANTGIVKEGLETLPALVRGVTSWAMSEMVERYALQMTGSSTSVRAFHDTLRLAGATARVMLCKAAARQWRVDWQECTTRDGLVVHLDKRLGFSALAELAAEESPPSDPPLKSSGDFTLIGKNVERLDIPSKTDGSARFGMDVRLPGMLFASVAAGPRNGGRVTQAETAVISATMPGVLSIVRERQWVAVLAETWWQADQALAVVNPQFDSRFTRSVGGSLINDQLQRALNEDEARVYDAYGDLQAGLTASRSVIQSDFETPHVAHACLEPLNATARYENGKLELWVPSQSISVVSMLVSKAMDMPETDITVYPTLIGGGFGRKIEADAALIAANLAKRMSRPVQVVFSREEDFRHDRFRPATKARMRGGVDEAGRITAWQCRIAGPSVQNSFMSRVVPSLASAEPDYTSVQGAVYQPYDFRNAQIGHVLVDSPIELGFWRAVGHSSNAFYVESFMDELASQAGQDPLDFRLAHLENAPRHAAVLNAAAEAIGYRSPLSKGRARGIALHESFGSIVALILEILLTDDGTLVIQRAVCAADCGPVIHPDNLRAQLEGGTLFALSEALHGRITFEAGLPHQLNLDSYRLLTMAEAPTVETVLVSSTEKIGGAGEIAVPPVAPALTNAIARAGGLRIRKLPLGEQQLRPQEQILRVGRRT